MSRSLRVVFMGTPEFAVAGLRGILQSHHTVVGIVTAPDRPSGRGKKVRFSAVKEEAISHGIPVYQPEKLSDSETIHRLKTLQADVFVVVAFRMLPKIVWSIPSLGTFNLHASLLPQYRGAAPIHWAIINGEKETGLTTFLIDDQIDTGALLLQKKISILPEETMGELSERMQDLSSDMLVETLDALALGSPKPVPQPKSANLLAAPKLTRENTRISWGDSGKSIVNFIHGLNPFPTAWSIIESEEEQLYVKVYRAHFIEGSPIHPPGTMTIEEQTLQVAVPDGYVFIDELQLPNKKNMDIHSLLNGYRFAAKSRFVL